MYLSEFWRVYLTSYHLSRMEIFTFGQKTTAVVLFTYTENTIQCIYVILYVRSKFELASTYNLIIMTDSLGDPLPPRPLAVYKLFRQDRWRLTSKGPLITGVSADDSTIYISGDLHITVVSTSWEGKYSEETSCAGQHFFVYVIVGGHLEGKN